MDIDIENIEDLKNTQKIFNHRSKMIYHLTKHKGRAQPLREQWIAFTHKTKSVCGCRGACGPCDWPRKLGC